MMLPVAAPLLNDVNELHILAYILCNTMIQAVPLVVHFLWHSWGDSVAK